MKKYDLAFPIIAVVALVGIVALIAMLTGLRMPADTLVADNLAGEARRPGLGASVKGGDFLPDLVVENFLFTDDGRLLVVFCNRGASAGAIGSLEVYADAQTDPVRIAGTPWGGSLPPNRCRDYASFYNTDLTQYDSFTAFVDYEDVTRESNEVNNAMTLSWDQSCGPDCPDFCITQVCFE